MSPVRRQTSYDVRLPLGPAPRKRGAGPKTTRGGCVSRCTTLERKHLGIGERVGLLASLRNGSIGQYLLQLFGNDQRFFWSTLLQEINHARHCPRRADRVQICA